MRFTPTLGLYCKVVREHRISLALNVSPGVGSNLLGAVQVRDLSSQEVLAEPRDVRKFRIHIGFGVLPCCLQHLLLAPPEPLGYLAQKDEQQHHEDPQDDGNHSDPLVANCPNELDSFVLDCTDDHVYGIDAPSDNEHASSRSCQEYGYCS